jgi:hypothetical protein
MVKTKLTVLFTKFTALLDMIPITMVSVTGVIFLLCMFCCYLVGTPQKTVLWQGAVPYYTRVMESLQRTSFTEYLSANHGTDKCSILMYDSMYKDTWMGAKISKGSTLIYKKPLWEVGTNSLQTCLLGEVSNSGTRCATKCPYHQTYQLPFLLWIKKQMWKTSAWLLVCSLIPLKTDFHF